TAFNELLETLKPKFSGLFVGAYYINNAIYIQDGRKARKESEILN
ncbi:ATPase, partial [Helicobacter pylori]